MDSCRVAQSSRFLLFLATRSYACTHKISSLAYIIAFLPMGLVTSANVCECEQSLASMGMDTEASIPDVDASVFREMFSEANPCDDVVGDFKCNRLFQPGLKDALEEPNSPSAEEIAPLLHRASMGPCLGKQDSEAFWHGEVDSILDDFNGKRCRSTLPATTTGSHVHVDMGGMCQEDVSQKSGKEILSPSMEDHLTELFQLQNFKFDDLLKRDELVKLPYTTFRHHIVKALRGMDSEKAAETLERQVHMAKSLRDLHALWQAGQVHHVSFASGSDVHFHYEAFGGVVSMR